MEGITNEEIEEEISNEETVDEIDITKIRDHTELVSNQIINQSAIFCFTTIFKVLYNMFKRILDF